MNEVVTSQPAYSEESPEILADATLTFEENLIVEDSGDCPRYGCICINYERCCGCFIQ
jgi:hypothetical protein